MVPKVTPQSAEILGLQALGWLVGDPDRLDRLLLLSGMEPAGLQAAAGDPHLLGAVLEFLLADEGLLLAFCEDNGATPAAIHLARHVLEG
jgi:Protein of unknown function (DUF3572)